ncbi:hypothetical protein [Streptomyces sp. NPDC102283]|uniref:hypothetical protein n=1 Tax=Streptomyces sp. NPDC102283 TaxID=3366155 RepID=UPI0037F4E1A4
MRLLLPELADTAQHAVQAAHDMRAADSTTAVQEARERAIATADDLVTAAGGRTRRMNTTPVGRGEYKVPPTRALEREGPSPQGGEHTSPVSIGCGRSVGG